MPGMPTPGNSCLEMLQEQEYSQEIQELPPIHYRLKLYIVNNASAYEYNITNVFVYNLNMIKLQNSAMVKGLLLEIVPLQSNVTGRLLVFDGHT